jgi:hypothetical protein
MQNHLGAYRTYALLPDLFFVFKSSEEVMRSFCSVWAVAGTTITAIIIYTAE